MSQIFWWVGTLLAAFISFFIGLEPIIIAIAVASQAPFLAVRAHLYYELSKSNK